MCTNIGNNLFRGHTHTESTEHLRTYTVMQNRGGAGLAEGGGGGGANMATCNHYHHHLSKKKQIRNGYN